MLVLHSYTHTQRERDTHIVEEKRASIDSWNSYLGTDISVELEI